MRDHSPSGMLDVKLINIESSLVGQDNWLTWHFSLVGSVGRGWGWGLVLANC